jgi:hypothetical protein
MDTIRQRLESGTISREDVEQKGLHARTMCFPEDA